LENLEFSYLVIYWFPILFSPLREMYSSSHCFETRGNGLREIVVSKVGFEFRRHVAELNIAINCITIKSNS
jgi:hypothetical protein